MTSVHPQRSMAESETERTQLPVVGHILLASSIGLVLVQALCQLFG